MCAACEKGVTMWGVYSLVSLYTVLVARWLNKWWGAMGKRVCSTT